MLGDEFFENFDKKFFLKNFFYEKNFFFKNFFYEKNFFVKNFFIKILFCQTKVFKPRTILFARTRRLLKVHPIAFRVNLCDCDAISVLSGLTQTTICCCEHRGGLSLSVHAARDINNDKRCFMKNKILIIKSLRPVCQPKLSILVNKNRKFVLMLHEVYHANSY